MQVCMQAKPNTPQITVKEIAFGSDAYKACCQLRHDVLRVPLGLELSEKDVAGEDKQHHLAAYDGQALCGLLLLKPLGNGLVKFRQMAVNPDYQGKGIGAQIMQFSEEFARAKQWNKIELNARVYAKGFYARLGYATEGDEFTEVTIPTVKMVKTLP